MLSEDESDTSALFTESELDDSDLDFARRRPRAPVAPPRGAPANDERDDAPRFSSEDEEDEPRRAPSPPPAAAPTWVGPGASSSANTRAAAAAAAAPVGRPGGATGGAVPTFSFSHRASDSGIGSARQTSYAPAASSRPPPTAPASRGGTASAQSSPARRPAAPSHAAASSQPNSSNILASVLGIDVERGVGGFDDDDDDEDVASPLRGGPRGGKESRRDRAARLAREGTSRRGRDNGVVDGKSLGALNLARVRARDRHVGREAGDAGGGRTNHRDVARGVRRRATPRGSRRVPVGVGRAVGGAGSRPAHRGLDDLRDARRR